MNPDQQTLWQRIQAHPLDDPHAAHPFSLRLAKENGWPPGFTRRAVEEYRRFVFLAAAADHPVSPSDAVDRVWHLHLLYTRDYWGGFCQTVLRMPLHHGPTRGGAAEHDKFADWYARTLASYRIFFGEPPADLWPEPAVHPETLRVDRASYWVIEKPRWLARLRASIGARQKSASAPKANGETAGRAAPASLRPATRASSVLLSGWASSVACPSKMEAATPPAPGWPFDLPGPEFLEFFLAYGALALAAALTLRWYLRQPSGLPATYEHVDGYEAAYLAGGPAQAFVAGLVGASQRKLVDVHKGKAKRTDVPLPPNLPLIERAICAATQPTGAFGTTLRQVRKETRDALSAIHAGLAERGMVLDARGARSVRMTPALVMATVLIFGAIKLKIGLDLGKPVGFLIVLLVIGAFVTLTFLLKRPRLTRRGGAMLRHLRAEHQLLVSTRRTALCGGDASVLLPLAVGLFGVNALHGTPLDGMRTDLKSVLNRGDSGTAASSGGCGGSCGGGGDGGGGDGGGGSGCGGCGGGGD